MVIEEKIEEHNRRITKVEGCVLEITSQLAKIQGSQSTVEMLLKWVIVPLIIILGALVGVKIAWPGT